MINEGSSLADTVQDLHDLLGFWHAHKDAMANTVVGTKDLAPRDRSRRFGPLRAHFLA